jgi:hypothetical protein
MFYRFVSQGGSLMQFRYQCYPPRYGKLGASTRYSTVASDWGNGLTYSLERHNVKCPANTLLTRWRLYRPAATKIAIEYW